MYLIHPKSWGLVKPPPGTRINAGHPLSIGLQAAWPFNEAGGKVVFDAVNPNNNGTLTNSPKWYPALNTGGLFFDSQSTQQFCDFGTALNATLNSSRFSIGARFRTFTATLDRLVLFGKRGAANNRQMSWEWNTTDRFAIGEENISIIATTAVNTTVLQTYHMLWTYNTGVHVLYQNGISAATNGAYTFAGSYSGTNGCGMNTLNNSTGIIDTIAVWSRTLLPDEARWLAAEPYAMFRSQSPVRRYFVPAAAAVGVPKFMQSYRQRRGYA